MMQDIFFILAGYLAGSVLYARVFARLFKIENFTEVSPDHNPGTANAFRYGGFRCGVLTLVCDLLKGFLPVFLYMKYIRPEAGLFLCLVMAAPVIGHAFPVFFHFQGGKGIAASFGCLLGLLPVWQPLALLALFFIFFSVIFRITSHYHRTFITYLCTLVSLFLLKGSRAIAVGFLLISSAVIFKLLTSKEDKEQMEVKLLWTR